QLWMGNEDQDSSCARLPVGRLAMRSTIQQPDLRCNVGGATGVSGEAPGEASPQHRDLPVRRQQGLGREVGERSCEKPAIGGNHYGPVMVYLRKVAEDRRTSSRSASTGLTTRSRTRREAPTYSTGFQATIPPALEAGDYQLRAEAIALHASSQPGGAQFYVTCYQLCVSFWRRRRDAGWQARRAADPGIQVEIWGGGFSEYTIPGPAVVSV
ncbi:lytic polysaccharide monooxygenase, partial [Colletotrichum gloeosporioides 23]